MIGRAVQLDPSVEVADDDRGRIVLLPHDGRSPVRLSRSDESVLAYLRRGEFDLEGRGIRATLDEPERDRFKAVAVALDCAGLLSDRRSAPGVRTVRWPSLARAFDALARVLTAPLAQRLSVAARGRLLQAVAVATVLGLCALWLASRGSLFAAAISPYWWAGIIVFVLGFPLLHELSHALVARLFGLQVTAVGAQHRGGLSWSPFVEVRRAVLSCDPTVRVWIPLAGVLCNMLLALLAGVWLSATQPGSLAAGVAGMLTVLLHIRVLIDGGFTVTTDASQALRAASELMQPADHLRLQRLVRGGYLLFLACSLCMVALSFAAAGSRA